MKWFNLAGQTNQLTDNNQGFVSSNILVIMVLVIMISVWLLTTPKLNIIQNLPSLPLLTNNKSQTPNSQQDSQIAQKPVIDKQIVNQLSVRQIKSPSDLDKINLDLNRTDLNNLNSSLNQLDINFTN